jgi:transglutaminase-like putative cysteine protease
MNGYAEIPTRTGMDGVIDKLALVENMADDTAHDREFAEFVLRKIAGAGSGADEQAAAWCEYIESLPYRREFAEVLRDPRETVGSRKGSGVGVGGDCDDLTLALLAGLRSLAIPCQGEILATEDGCGFHIRARVGLPPMNPKLWMIVDPVWKSEREWTMLDANPVQNALAKRSFWYAPTMRGTTEDERPKDTFTMLSLLTIVLATVWLSNKLFPPQQWSRRR